ncbi:ribosome-binding factor A, partial [Leisingera sp. HS039]|nr:ribosome-binding factor A [Leisingera sp. HS039]
MAKNKFQDGPGPSQRQLRVGELIRRSLSEVLARGDVHDPDLNRMSITVGGGGGAPARTLSGGGGGGVG